jgi:thymidylate kinase
MNKDFPRPHMAFYLDIPAEEAIRRINQRHHEEGAPLEIFEVTDFQKKVRQFFLDLIGNPNFPELRLVNGRLHPKQVHERICQMVQPFLPTV